jgi:hypothetical protein
MSGLRLGEANGARASSTGVGAGVRDGLAGIMANNKQLDASLAPMIGSYGTRVAGRGPTLATSFRESSSFVMRDDIAMGEETDTAAVCEQNSDDEWAERKVRGLGRRKGSRNRMPGGGGVEAADTTAGGDSSDEEVVNHAVTAHEDGDVFQTDF